MNKLPQQSFSIKCQCSAYKSGLLLTSKKKSKLSTLILNPQQNLILIVPLNSKQQPFTFQLKKLKHIHRKYVEEGKITLEFSQQQQKIPAPLNDDLKEENKTQRLSQIYVQAASPQNLELLIDKIITIKKVIKAQNKSTGKKQATIEKEPKARQTSQDQDRPNLKSTSSLGYKKKQNYPKLQKFVQNIAARKRDPLGYDEKLRQYQFFKHKQTGTGRKNFCTDKRELEKPLVKEKKYSKSGPAVDILDLPAFVLQKILQYSKLQLKHRLISKNFDSFVLSHIQNLNFRDEVDDQTFNKLAKYATNIRGRLKNVRTIQLIDRYNDSELQKDRAKSLFFGEWKEISKKNIQQIKGLRVHTLQIPYNIKFDFSSIYGINLRQLHLYSKSEVTTSNYLISDQYIVYLFKSIETLQAFSIPYINSSVLEEIAQTLKEKIKQIKSLKFGSINQNCKKEETWFLFHPYEQLKILKAERVLKGGLLKRDIKHKFTFPLYIEELQIGSCLSDDTVKNLPTTLHKLKLIGDQYLNLDVANMFLPYLKVLDVSQCTMVRPSLVQSLQQCYNLKMVTSWQKQDIEYWKELALNKNIQILSVRGLISRR